MLNTQFKAHSYHHVLGDIGKGMSSYSDSTSTKIRFGGFQEIIVQIDYGATVVTSSVIYLQWPLLSRFLKYN